MNLFTRGSYVAEMELRYRPYDRPGAVRLGAWFNRAFAGSYNDAVALAAINPGLTANDTIPLTRQGRTKYGFYLNLEQEISDSVGAFARFSWNDGRSEICPSPTSTPACRPACRSRAPRGAGPTTRSGIAGALNSISGDHANYLAAGGLGILVGDGALTYGSEGIIETYYSLQLAKGIFVTADYQFLSNPAYNAVRGPAHIFSGRLLARF